MAKAQQSADTSERKADSSSSAIQIDAAPITTAAAASAQPPLLQAPIMTTANTTDGPSHVPSHKVTEARCCGCTYTVTTFFVAAGEAIAPVLQAAGKILAPVAKAFVTTELEVLKTELQSHASNIPGIDQATSLALNGMINSMVAGAQAASTDVINGTVNASSIDNLKATLSIAAHTMTTATATAATAGVALNVNLATAAIAREDGGMSQPLQDALNNAATVGLTGTGAALTSAIKSLSSGSASASQIATVLVSQTEASIKNAVPSLLKAGALASTSAVNNELPSSSSPLNQALVKTVDASIANVEKTLAIMIGGHPAPIAHNNIEGSAPSEVVLAGDNDTAHLYNDTAH